MQPRDNVPAGGSRRAGGSGFSMIELLVVLAITGVIAATAVPMIKNTLDGFRLSGDARGLANALTLAKLQAASNFTQSRLYVDFTTAGYHIDLKTGGAWVQQTATRYLGSATEQYGFGVVATPPANTQAAIAQAPQCTTIAGAAIGNTACIVFNSRGIPIDNAGAPTGNDAFYVADNTAVFGVTVSAGALIRLWRTTLAANPNWVLQ